MELQYWKTLVDRPSEIRLFPIIWKRPKLILHRISAVIFEHLLIVLIVSMFWSCGIYAFSNLSAYWLQLDSTCAIRSASVVNLDCGMISILRLCKRLLRLGEIKYSSLAHRLDNFSMRSKRDGGELQNCAHVLILV